MYIRHIYIYYVYVFWSLPVHEHMNRIEAGDF